MKKTWMFIWLMAAASTARAFYEELATADGTFRTNAFITCVEPDGLSYMHGQGVTKLFFRELSEDVQRKYNYDPAIAAVYGYYTRKAQMEWSSRQEEAARVEAEERQKHLDAIRQEEDEQKIKSTAEITNLKLVQMQEDGSWLCRAFHRKKAGFTLGRAKFTQEFDESQILVEGLPATVVDNDEWRGRIYDVGIQQLKSGNGAIRTLRRYKVIP